ncbi:hypothetical protein SporoP37_10500 [Sporosarcina sp. P37]|uniref:DUF2975 domain-containing protein n=1 Tax=unclassified Sporosarcina TaxID=2647733 RepID=UPI0009BF2098|nr:MULTISPECIES: DUF2975 domain-containing protein [unclassified Sporosarcina]ARD48529.1 hypothetical protein SporoP33_10085 [Sporosarcina sp. P33]ARK25034.1 hypothetical protein SporoP37_10500 [Sporosarcina sp. P37]PID18180.1 DUF2975 domain-containing protein [Sporosarcina sp. P35]
MKRGTTLILKVAVLLIGIPVLAFCLIGLPWLVKNPANAEYANMLYPIVSIMYVSAVPYFIALFQAFRLLSFIDENNAFSSISVRALKKIKYCAISISILYMVGMPFFFLLGDKDDAPGIVLIGLVIIFASMVVSVFSAVLQKLLRDAIDIKSENDLTV